MSWQSELACWVLRRRTRPETGKPRIDVARARALTSKRAWSPKVPPGWRLEERYGQGDAPLRGEWLFPDNPSATTLLYLHATASYFYSPPTPPRPLFPPPPTSTPPTPL